MNSHIDTQQPTHKQWLSLTEYSQKYNVSISTLRRRIRAGTITVKLEEGKYFIVDKRQDISVEQDQGLETPEKKTEDVDIQRQGSFINKLLNTQQEFHRLLTEKEKKIETLQNQISDFNNLVSILEKKILNFNTLIANLKKENLKLKTQREQEKKIEEWLNK